MYTTHLNFQKVKLNPSSKKMKKKNEMFEWKNLPIYIEWRKYSSIITMTVKWKLEKRTFFSRNNDLEFILPYLRSIVSVYHMNEKKKKEKKIKRKQKVLETGKKDTASSQLEIINFLISILLRYFLLNCFFFLHTYYTFFFRCYCSTFICWHCFRYSCWMFFSFFPSKSRS